MTEEHDQDPGSEDKAGKRVLNDRRKRPTPMLGLHILGGRRRWVRRVEDKDRHLYVDRYGLPFFLMLMSILLLGVADAFLTIYHVQVNDAVELNPVMNHFLGFGPQVFFRVKYLLTGICLMVLCLHKNLPVVRYLLASILIIYLVIVINHIYIFFII